MAKELPRGASDLEADVSMCAGILFSSIIPREGVGSGAADGLPKMLRPSFSWCFDTSNDLTFGKKK